MRNFHVENLCHDPVHGYIAFTAPEGLPDGEIAERLIIDHPWLQRLRHIHQLQTAWWVYPTAEHTRFQHVLGAMHLASCVIDRLYPSLCEVCDDVPSRGYVETLLRMAGLLHDVGHGPFGHFFDDHYLAQYGLTHETLGAKIIVDQLGDLLRQLRRNPNSAMEDGEALDPEQVAWLIQRPKADAEDAQQPHWLRLLRSLLSGIYTIDNMDFVLRDAYMSGYAQRAYDIERLLHYSFFTEHGLTIHDRGMDALMRFMSVKAELFKSIYFHRTVRAIDLTLADLFAQGKEFLFPGNPAEQLDDYLLFTGASLLVDVARWTKSDDLSRHEIGRQWDKLLRREIDWLMVCQRSIVFGEEESETSSIFSDPAFVEKRVRDLLPSELSSLPIKVDIARHIYRPNTHGPARDQNFLYDSARDRVRALTDNQLFKGLPISHRVCRIYAHNHEHDAALAAALDQLIGPNGADDLTNM